MRQVPIVWVLSSLLLAEASFAVDWKHQSFATKRQAAAMVVDCMKKRMSRDRLISYNDAAKLCKQEVSKQFEGAPGGPLVADTKP